MGRYGQQRKIQRLLTNRTSRAPGRLWIKPRLHRPNREFGFLASLGTAYPSRYSSLRFKHEGLIYIWGWFAAIHLVTLQIFREVCAVRGRVLGCVDMCTGVWASALVPVGIRACVQAGMGGWLVVWLCIVKHDVQSLHRKMFLPMPRTKHYMRQGTACRDARLSTFSTWQRVHGLSEGCKCVGPAQTLQEKDLQ